MCAGSAEDELCHSELLIHGVCVASSRRPQPVGPVGLDGPDSDALSQPAQMEINIVSSDATRDTADDSNQNIAGRNAQQSDC